MKFISAWKHQNPTWSNYINFFLSILQTCSLQYM